MTENETYETGDGTRGLNDVPFAEPETDAAPSSADGRDDRTPSKMGPIIALVALVVVLAVGFFAYDALTNARTASNGAASASADAPQPIGNASDNPAYQLDVPLLADYDATVYSDTGEPRLLTEIADGKPLVINFWATWCPYCIQEMPDYLDLFNEYGDRISFAFVDCADGTRETVEAASSWLEENGFAELPAYYDKRAQAQYQFGVASLPTTVVVSAKGEILTISPGRIDPALMRNALDSVLQQ